MRRDTGRIRAAAMAMAIGGCLAVTSNAQVIRGPMVGQDEPTWQAWQAAAEAIKRAQWPEADTGLAAVAAKDPSPLRLSLMAGRTGVQLMKMGVENGDLGPAGADLLKKVVRGDELRKLAEDAWHFAAMGDFQIADANFRKFLDAAPDAVAALELAELGATREDLLIRLVSNPEVGKAAKAMLDLLARGAKLVRTNPARIQKNIERLGGSPQAVYNATNRLVESGEYAVPYLLDYLQRADKADLHPAIISALPQLGRDAVGPLCIALQTEQTAMRRLILEALGKLGYAQALPYVQLQIERDVADQQVKVAAQAALKQIEATSGRSAAGMDAASLCYDLADQYYYDRGSLVSDPRAEQANVWYWRDGRLEPVSVPRDVFNEIMAMRCCEMALKLRPNYTDAIAVWLAANFRREAQLGVASVDAETPDDALAADATRPAGTPRAIYFARAAGAQFAHMVLARGIRDRDPAVVLGAVSALASTAGATNLVGPEDAKQPLVETLSFPDLLIRVRAALALGAALPTKTFDGAEKVVPVLAQALMLTGKKHALVVDTDEQNLNRVAGILRAAGFTVATGEQLLAGLNAARKELPVVDVIFLASDITQPGLAQGLAEIRKDFVFASSPVVILAKAQQTLLAKRFAGADERVEEVLASADDQRLLDAWQRVSHTAGRTELTDALAFDLAMQAADVLHKIAFSRSPVYDLATAESALGSVLASRELELRTRAAKVLALLNSSAAQRALAATALDDKNDLALRLVAFDALAQSGRVRGSLLDDALVNRLIETVMSAEDLTVRTAASAALGALNLAGNRASGIILTQYQG